MAESELDKHTKIITEFTRKVDELQIKADEAVKLKDQVDEYVKIFRNLNILFTYLDTATQLINFRRRRMSWRNTKRNSRKAQTCGNTSRPVNSYAQLEFETILIV